MTQSIVKLTAISIVTLMLAFAAVFGVRQMVGHATYSAPAHPWFQRDFWWVFSAEGEALCHPETLDAQTPTKDWIVKLPVQRLNESWLVNCPTGKIALQDFLKATPHADFLLEILARDTWNLDELVDTVKPSLATKNFAMMSDSAKVGMFLRKRVPEWLFTADSASLLRLRFFESFYLEKAIDFWPDLVVLNYDPRNPFRLDARGAAELLERKKRILWNWTDKQTQEPDVPIQGIMTNRPSAALEKFGKRL